MSNVNDFTPLPKAGFGIGLVADTPQTFAIPKSATRIRVVNPDGGAVIFMEFDTTVNAPKSMAIGPNSKEIFSCPPGGSVTFQSGTTPTFYISFGN